MSASVTGQPWQAVKVGERGAWNAEHVATGCRFLSMACGRKVHAALLAEIMSGILPDVPEGLVPDDVMARLYVVRASFYRFDARDASRSLDRAKDAWFEHVRDTTVWVRTDDRFGFECRPNADDMGEGWERVPMQPPIFGGAS